MNKKIEEEQLNHLTALIESGSTDEKEKAAWALKDFGEKALPILLHALKTQLDHNLRMTFVCVMCRMGEKALPYVEPLFELYDYLGDTELNYLAKLEAIRFFGEMGTKGIPYLERIVNLATDDESDFKDRAIKLLKKIRIGSQLAICDNLGYLTGTKFALVGSDEPAISENEIRACGALECRHCHARVKTWDGFRWKKSSQEKMRTETLSVYNAKNADPYLEPSPFSRAYSCRCTRIDMSFNVMNLHRDTEDHGGPAWSCSGHINSDKSER